MIKPSHYDDDGYPIVWWRTLIPSNSLAAVNGIARDCAARQVLGPEVRINLVTLDETNTHIVPARIIRDLRRRGARALIGLIGVQSNQFDRTLDLAREFRAAGLPVAIGGFHVSGCLAMLKAIPAEIQAALDIGCSLFAGECEEGRLDEVLRDAWRGALKPIYNYLKDLPDLEGAPLPVLPRDALRRNSQSWSSFDLGRGCPFQCSFCTIINVQGRKSRFRTADDLEAIMRENHAQGIKAFFITDDNLARNRRWEEFFDRLIRLREEEGIKANLTIQVDTLCHKIPNFIDKAARAGAMRVFIGLENINPDNLVAAKKNQNKITDYRHMLQAWRDRGVFLFAGYILGFPGDTRESILRDIDIIKRELPIDVLQIAFLTPLPGSEDHRTLLERGAWMDPDLNKYNLHHRVSHHPTMSDAEWEAAYADCWRLWFADEHMETVARRHAVRPGGRPKKAVQYMNEFKMLWEVEGLHAMEGGVLRRKRRKSRRPGFRRESPVTFYPRYALGTAAKAWRYWRMYAKAARIVRRVESDPARYAYSDIAIQPVSPDELETLDLFHQTAGGEAFVARKQRQDAIMEAVHAPHQPAA
ncbi:radical SAM protein [Sphingomonas parva]|uniref:Radical SAM protein n=2 Tax=Sphingomonas parva TaxID=2555898 RepID=A0A4Y8ZV67_9SPHN|nr:radical SAM protein [Sphingomonas parva]